MIKLSEEATDVRIGKALSNSVLKNNLNLFGCSYQHNDCSHGAANSNTVLTS